MATAYEVFKKCERESITLNPSLFTNLLCLVAGLGDIGSGGSQERGDVPQDYAKAIEIFDSMRSTNIQISEAAYSAIIRCCSQNNQFTKAITLYEDMKSMDILPKLRCINSLIAACGKNGDTSTCFSLFQDITQRFHLVPTEKEYRNLLRACLKTKDVRFIAVFLEMMEELLTLSDHSTLHTIIAYFYMISHHSSQTTAFPYTITFSSVDRTTGIVQASNQQLRSIDLDESTQLALLAQLEGFAVNRDPSHRYKMNNKVKLTQMMEGREVKDIPSTTSADHDKHNKHKTEATGKWNNFKQHLEALQQSVETSFNIIIDGANVGYYKQNFPNAPTHVDYHQIDALFTTLLEQGFRPLLILHSRHIVDGLAPNTHDVQAIIKRWRESGRLYHTPKGFNDDWFWLYATIHYHLPVVTNDEMRDHHFQLLSPRYFMRWRERHRVPFDLYFVREELNVHDDCLHDAEEDSEMPKKQKMQQEKGKIVFPPGVHRSIAKFHFPLCFSFRMQYVHHDDGSGMEGYYIPPISSSVLSTEVVEVDEELEEDVKVFIRSLYHQKDKATEAEGQAMETGENQEQKERECSKLWLVIYRVQAAAE